MKMGLTNNQGQAAAELAILGVLLILAFSFVMNFGQSLGKIQQTKMESFRLALQKAFAQNGTVSYTLKKNTNLASVNSSFFRGQDSISENTGSVTWSKGASGPDGTTDEGTYAYWQINKSPPIEPGYHSDYQYGPTGAESEDKIKMPVSVYKVDEVRAGAYNYSLNKQENNSAIDYSKQANVVDFSSGTLHSRRNKNIDQTPGDETDNVDPDYVDTTYIDGLPHTYADTQVYTYDKDWNVTHEP